MSIDILAYELKYKNDRDVLDLLAHYKELLSWWKEECEENDE